MHKKLRGDSAGTADLINQRDIRYHMDIVLSSKSWGKKEEERDVCS